MAKKRDKIKIAAEILNACRIPQGKTKIVHACNLNFRTVEPLLELLVKRKLLAEKNGQFEATDEGLKIYMKIIELYKLLDSSP